MFLVGFHRGALGLGYFELLEEDDFLLQLLVGEVSVGAVKKVSEFHYCLLSEPAINPSTNGINIIANTVTGKCHGAGCSFSGIVPTALNARIVTNAIYITPIKNGMFATLIFMVKAPVHDRRFES